MHPFRHKTVRPPSPLLCAWVWILCLPGLSGLRANPVGEVVQSGTASFERTPDRLTVTTGDRVVIGWDDFSIRQGETTQFVQPSAGSLAINRVMTGNPSQLFGTLQANGQLVLINPNGIVVGGGAVIDTGGFLASTLDADPDKLVNGVSWEFRGDSAAVLENHGTILARSGDLVLISREVRNTGTLSAPKGTVALGAGREVLVSWLPDAERRLFVRPAGLDGRVDNLGAIEAARAELEASGGNPYALAVNNEGTIRATGSVTQEGRVYLVAREGNLRHSGSIYARNADGSGGTVRIRGRSVETAGPIDASSESARGGAIRIEGDNILLKSGTILNADGPTGGGRIEIGGGLRGLDPAIANADEVTAETGVRLTADALHKGDGGVVVVWAADRMAFAGTVSVRGGAVGGNGGFVEVSGLQSWSFPDWLTGVDVSAPAGTAGTFLIDPNDITIAAGPGAAIGASPANANTLFADSITAFLATGNLIIETTGTGGTGNITVQTGANLTWASANSLTLKADASLTFQSGVTVSGGGALTLQFAQSVNGTLTFAEALPAAASLTLSGGSGGAIVATIVGPDNGATFTITGAAAGSLNDGIHTANFTNVDHLTGGAGDDVFVLSGVTVFGGNIDGGGSVNGNTLDYSGATGFAATVNIGDFDPSNRLGTATGIEIFIAPTAGSQALQGPNSGSQAWAVTATGVGAGGVLYQGFESLSARNASDTFTFAQGAVFAGAITGGGGGGTDVIVLTGPSQSVSLSAAGAGSVNGSGTFSGIESLDGGTSGILTGPDSAQTWNITGANSGTLLTTAFQNFATLNGGSNVDTFVFGASGSLSGDLNGGGGADVINLSAGGAVGGTIDGGSGLDSLTGLTTGSGWNITGGTSGTVGLSDFTGIDVLTGGTGNDTFIFGSGVAFAGSIAGGAAGTDQVVLSGTGQSVVLSGAGAGSVNGSGTFSGMESLDGGSGGLLTGPNSAQTWSITGADSGTVLSMVFDHFGTLTGGTNVDTFNFGAAGSLSGDLNGGNGADVVDLSLGGSVAGTIDGGAGSDSILGATAGMNWSITGATAGSAGGSAFTGIDVLTGGAGDDVFTFDADAAFSGSITGGATGSDAIVLTGSGQTVTLTAAGAGSVNGGAGTFSGIESLDGGTGGTLAGWNAALTWSITGSNSGTLGTMVFQNFSNLNGGTANDTFTFGTAGVVSGTVDGGAGGTDVVNLSTDVDVVTITGTGAGSVVDGSAANVINNFTGIETVNGGATGANTLVNNTNAAAVFNITSADSGTLTTTVPATLIAFGSFGNLTGDDGFADRFVFANGIGLSGAIAGGTGTDILDFTANTTAVTVNLVSGSSTQVAGGIGGIETVIGGSGADDLTGSSVFSSTLQGNGGNDTYRVVFGGAAIATTITEAGGGGTDTVELTGTAGADTFTQTAVTTLGDGNHVVSYGTNVETVNLDGLGSTDTLVGFNQANTFNITGNDAGDLGVVRFAAIENLTGGSSNDTFVFASGASMSGVVAGGAGTVDDLQLSGDNDSVVMTGTGAGSVNGTGSFTGIESIDGGGGDNSLQGPNTAQNWSITGADSGSVLSTGFGHFSLLKGGTAADAFVFDDAVVWAGSINGGTGAGNTLGFANYTTGVTVSLAGGTSLQVTGGFSNIQSVTGGSGGDDLTGSSVFSSTLQGNGGNDTYRVVFGGAAIATTITEAGGGGTDTVELTGTAGADTFTLTAATTLGDGNHVVSYGTNVETVSLDGLGSMDTLVGFNQANTFNITGNDAGDLGVIHFSTIESLTGGNLADTFVFTTAGILNGTLDGGGGGSDQINLSTDADVVTITGTGAGSVVDGSAANVINGFAGIETINGGATGANTLVNGTGSSAIFNITGANSGTLTTTVPATLVTFGGFGNLNGAATFSDTFTFGTAGVISGTVDGGSSGTDVVNLSTDVDVVTITGTGAGSVVDGSAANVINSFTGIETVNGGATGANTLVNGTAGDVIFNVTGSNSGTLTTTTPTMLVGFAAFGNLAGGIHSEVFTFGTAGTISGTVDGGSGGTDVVNLSTDADVVTITGTGAGSVVDGSAANVINSFTGIETVNGGATGANTLVNGTGAAAVFNITGANSGTLTTAVPATLVTFGGMGGLNGGGNTDTFVFSAAGSLTGDLLGGGGADVYDFSAGGQVGGAVNDTVGQSELYGTLTAGSMTLGSVRLNTSTVLDTSAADGNVQLGAVAGNNQSLRVTTGAGLKTFQGAVTDLDGGSLAALVLSGSGTAEFLSTVTSVAGGLDASSAGRVIFRGSVTLGNGSTGSAFAGPVQFSGASPVSFSGFDGLAFSGGIEVSGADLTVNSRGSNLDIAGLTAGGRSVTLDAGAGTLDFLGSNMTGLDQLTLTAALAKLASVTGTGAQVYTGGLRVTGTLTAPGVKFAGSGTVAAGDGVSAASLATGSILLDKSGSGPVVLRNDRTVSLSADSPFTALDLEVLSGNLNIISGLQGSSRIGLVVDAGNLTQSTGVLAAPVVELAVSGNAGTAPAPIRTTSGTSLSLDLGGNAFLVENSRTRLGTEITYTGGVAAQTVDLTLSAGPAYLYGDFGSTGDDFIIRVPSGDFLQVGGRFSANLLRVIASGAVGTEAAPLLTRADRLDLNSGGSGGTSAADWDAVSYQGNAASGSVQILAGGTLTVSGNVTTTGNVLLRALNGNIVGSTVAFPVISADVLGLEAPQGGLVFNNLSLLLNQGNATIRNAVSLGAITVAGNFAVSSGGALTQTGPLNVGGVFSVTVPGQSVVLSNTGNRFGSIRMRAGSATLAEADSMQVDLIESTGPVSLASGGAISQTGAITAPSLTLSAALGIVLENLNNIIPSLGSVTRGGEFRFYTRNDLAIQGNINGGIITNGVEIRAAGNLALLPGTRIAASGSGNDIRLAALAGTFTDTSASAFSLDPLAGSRFVVYSGTRSQTATGLLTVNFVQLSSPYPTAPSGSGNAVLLREGVPGDTTIVIVTPFVPVAAIGGISIGDFGMRSVDVGSSGLLLGGGNGGAFGLFSLDANGRSGDIGDHEAEALLVLRKTLQQDMSAAAKDEILQFLADILAGRLDPREVRLPPGLIYQEDSRGNAVIVTPDMVDDFLISLLDPANHQKLMQALGQTDKK